MLLENKFYKIISSETNGLEGKFNVAILPDCNVYQGHFPGDPVCPGVCNIETIKECTIQLINANVDTYNKKDLRIKTIKQCRLTAIATPSVCPEVTITISATPKDEAYIVIAEICDDNQSYMTFKGTLE